MSRSRPVFYGWVVVAGAFVSHLLNYGTLTVAFGVFFPFMTDSLGFGRGLLASVFALARVVSAGIAPVLGPVVDRRGPRVVMALGAVSLAAGSVLLARAHEAWELFLAYGVVMALGSVALGELTADASVSRWFVRRRSLALAYATMGLSAAGIVIPIPLAALIARVGWRPAWLALAAVVLLLGLAAAAGMRRRPEDHGLVPDGDLNGAGPGHHRRPTAAAERSLTAREAARTPAFWLLVLSTNLAGLALFGINLHLFSYITDKGVTATRAAGIVTYLYVLHTAAKPLWGLIAQRVSVRYCIACCYLGGAAGVALLTVSASTAGLLAFATVYGLTRGAQSFVTSLAWADYFGRDAQGAIRGLASPFRFVAGAAGPLLGGILFDLTRSYVVAFTVFAAAFAAGGLIALGTRPPRPVA